MTDATQGSEWDLLIQDAVRLDDAAPVSIGIRAGQIEAVAPTLAGHAAARIDARGGLVTPSFVDPHFHIDKVLSRDLLGARGPEEALARAHEAKIHFTVADVEERACRALRLAAAHGIGRLHAQIDVDYATRLVSFEGVMRARDRFAGVVDVTLVAFPQEGIVADPEAPALLREALSMGAAAVGGLPEVEASVEDQRTHIETVLDLAAAFDVGVEMHCDYLDRVELKTLEMLAEATRAHGMQGRVVASHCNALSLYPDAECGAGDRQGAGRRDGDRGAADRQSPDAGRNRAHAPQSRLIAGEGAAGRRRQRRRRRRQHVRHLVPLQPDGPDGARLHGRCTARASGPTTRSARASRWSPPARRKSSARPRLPSPPGRPPIWSSSRRRTWSMSCGAFPAAASTSRPAAASAGWKAPTGPRSERRREAPPRLSRRGPDRAPDPLGRERHLHMADAEVPEGIEDRIADRRRRAGGARARPPP